MPEGSGAAHHAPAFSAPRTAAGPSQPGGRWQPARSPEDAFTCSPPRSAPGQTEQRGDATSSRLCLAMMELYKTQTFCTALAVQNPNNGMLQVKCNVQEAAVRVCRLSARG